MSKRLINKARLFLLVCLFFLGGCAHASSVTTVLLVRHAEKAKAPKKDPVLTHEGQKRAEQLAFMLGGTLPKVIYATGYQRTQLTVRPLAQALGQQVVVHDADKSAALAEEILNKHRGSTVVVAGHSNTVPEIITALGGEASPISESEYDNLFVVTITDDGMVKTMQLHFGEKRE